MTAIRRPPIAAMALALVAAIAAVLLLRGGDDGYRVRVAIDDAAGLRENFHVKIAGAPVGTVTDVDLDDRDRAIAELRLDEGAGPVGLDARAAVRASNLLGEKYVDLVPGDLARPAPSGHLIPRTRTTTPSDLDDILSVLDADTRVALAAFLVGQGDALAGRGADLAAALRRLPGAIDEARTLVAGLATDNRALGRLLERSDRILAAAAPERADLGRLVVAAEGALGAIDSRRAQLGDTVRRAPGALRQLRGTLVELERAAAPLGPASRGLARTAAPLEETLRALPAFTDAARPTLRTARAVAPTLRRLGRDLTPVVRRVRPAVADLRTFSDELRPVSKLVDQATPDLLGVMQGWARAIQNRDEAGHVFRVSVELGGDALNRLSAFGRGRRAAPTRRPGTDGAPPPSPGRGGPPAERPRGIELPGLRLPELPLPKVRLPDVRVPGLELPRGGRHAGDGAPTDPTPFLDFLLGP